MTFFFEDRADAGRQLAAAVGTCDPARTVILALPRGGVPVAAEVARATGAPLDLIFVRKIGAPGHEELAIGAVVDGMHPHIAVNTGIAGSYGLSDDEVRRRAEPLLKEIERRRALYLDGRPPMPLIGKTVILIDDGIATGASMRAALLSVREQTPAETILALPVAPPGTETEFSELADRVICLHTPPGFMAVGAHYRYFGQTSDEEVRQLMQEFAAPTANSSETERAQK